MGRSLICGGPPGTAQSGGVPFAYPLGQVCWICEAPGNCGTVCSAACRDGSGLEGILLRAQFQVLLW